MMTIDKEQAKGEELSSTDQKIETSIIHGRVNLSFHPSKNPF